MLRNSIAALAFAMAAAPAFAQEPVLYTSNPVPAFEAVQATVKAKLDANLGVITGGSGVLLRRLEAEVGNVQADLFWSSSANTLGAFEGLFEAYDSPELAAIPEALHYPGNLFQPANIHLVTIMVNNDILNGATAPTSWAELADPVWSGRIIMPDPANSSTGYTIAWGLSKLLDADTYKAVVANVVTSGSSSAVPKGVAMGEYAVGLTFETNSYAYVDGGQTELTLAYPTEGTFQTVEFAGLVKDAPAGDVAKRTIDAILSQDAQIALLKAAFRRPTRSDIKVSDHVALPELASVNIFAVDEMEAASNRDAFLAEWAEMPKAGDIE
jgi:iron(III) transport system substrate-binding protein